MKREDEITAYREAMGDDATIRQLALARDRCYSCGSYLPNHSPLCPKAARERARE